jgi:hypothetical protein
MRATFNSQALRIEADIFELIEFKPANKLFVLSDIKNILFLLFCLISILQDNLIVSKIICNTRKISLLLIECI